MVCPLCNHPNADQLLQCEKCSTPLPMSDQTLNTDMGSEWSAPVADVVVAAATLKPLTAGTVLGKRYEIIRMLGQGGMGAVYQAHDRELDRQVALKVIRQDMVANQEILKRFKQELILARQITHKNVIRIFELGQADGFKFITMEYIEGEDLQSLLKRKKKLASEEATSIIAQVCRALEAAHAEGVIHRDLKPQNIMLDKTGRAYVMDFGIARSTRSPGVTQTGALIGTPEYMSPEQAKGQTLDARSDLFAVGIIFYEMLSGVTPFDADTTMGKLWKRTSEPARPLGELDKTIPPALSEIVRKCLEIDPKKRFASASELLEQIEIWQGPGAGTRVSFGKNAALPGYAKWMGAGLAAVLVVAGLWFRSKLNLQSTAPHAPVTLLIADFDNQTADPAFDGTLEPMLGIALEEAPFVSSYNRGQAMKVAAGVRPGATRLDPELAQGVATREGVSLLVTGSISRQAGGYRVQAAALDTATGKSMAQAQKQVSSKQDVLRAAAKLAVQMRKGLGDTISESAEQAAAEIFSTTSLEATHAYALGQDLEQAGKGEEAIAAYRQALEFDPNLGRAYAGLAALNANRGQREEAEKNYQAAMARIDRMTDREKYRTQSRYYLLMRNQPKAVEALTALVKQFPADTEGYTNLALAYFYQRDMTKALEEQQRALGIMPHSIAERSNLSVYALYAGDFEAAEKEALKVLKENPGFEVGARTLALARLGQGHPEEARQEYLHLQGMSPRGAGMATTGLADLALYEGRITDAVGILEQGIREALARKDHDSAAHDQASLAQTQMALNKTSEALTTATKAAAASQDEDVLYRTAEVFLAAGQEARALELVAPLEQRREAEPQAYAKLIAGEAQLKKGKAREAVNTFQKAQELSDTWLGRLDLGRAYLDAGAFPEASSEFDVCLKRQGEASSVFLDGVPSFRFLPAAYFYQGRAREGLKSPGAAESYKTLLAIKEKGTGDPLAVEAAKRLAALK